MNDERKTKKELIAELQEMRRGNDIQRQQIAAVGRVQMAAMSMQSSDDFLQLVGTVFRELMQLNIVVYSFAVLIYDEEVGTATRYVARESPRKYGLTWTSPLLVDFNENIVVGTDIEEIDIGRLDVREDKVSRVRWSGDQWRDVQQRTFVDHFGIEGDWPQLDAGEAIIVFIPFAHGVYWFIGPDDTTEANEAVAREFADAISLGCIRFLDFQQLEQQAEQAGRERAVERVRAEAMAMRKSDDIVNVVAVILEEMIRLGINAISASIGFIDEDKKWESNYIAIPHPRRNGIKWTLADSIEVIDDVAVMRWETDISDENLEAWRKKEPLSIKEPMTIETLVGQLANMYRDVNKADIEEQVAQNKHFQNLLGDRVYTTVPFQYGSIGYNEKELVSGHIAVVEELTEALSLGYLRYLDFQQLEEQAEQARRERAVERVRTEAMAMRESDDLLKVVGAVMRELQTLGVDTEICAITFVDEESKINHSFQAFISPQVANIAWKSAELVAIDERIAVTLIDYLFENLAYWLENWKRGEVWQSELQAEYIAHRAKQYSRTYALDGLFPFTERDTVCIDVPYSLGTIAVWVPEYRDELVDIIRQFIVGVELGYMRYLDIQKADQAQQNLIDELEEELQTAHNLQMGLMPTESPQIEGFDITGRCIPANHVSGDFFQYFQQDGKLSICMADVTGHAMKAAIPVVMFSGVLKTEMRHGVAIDALFANLNETMHGALDSRTYVCFAIGELDLADRSFRLANSGCPYPFHFRASTGDVTELQVDAYPLGVRAETAYAAIETRLDTGDYVVFCSDGIIEAGNADEEIFGFEQTAETIRTGCAEGLSAEALIDRLIGAVQDFAGDTPQGDDMTCVVLRVEEAIG